MRKRPKSLAEREGGTDTKIFLLEKEFPDQSPDKWSMIPHWSLSLEFDHRQEKWHFANLLREVSSASGLPNPYPEDISNKDEHLPVRQLSSLRPFKCDHGVRTTVDLPRKQNKVGWTWKSLHCQGRECCCYLLLYKLCFEIWTSTISLFLFNKMGILPI